MSLLKRSVVLLITIVMVLSSSSLAFSQEKVIAGEYYNLSDYEKLAGKKISKYSEAPMLADLVKQGKLPPVEQRIPKNPLVVTPVEEVGQYGGTWRRAWLGLSDQWGPNKICVEHLLMFDKSGTKVLPNIAESWNVSRDARVYTFKIREGIKWSDGTPLTTDDVMFWYEDVILNKELTPNVPLWLTSGGKPCEIEKVDTYTFRVKFAQPSPLFLINICKQGGNAFFLPKHYMKQFHPKYTSKEEIEKKAKEAGFQFWYQLFDARGMNSNAWLQNPQLPVLYPWRAASSPTATTMILERNPYYWKVDPAGNQLPYIDKIAQALLENREMIVMKAISGEIDMQMRHMSLSDYTLLMENKSKGGYRVLQWKQGVGADVMICLNQNVKDPVLRKLFEDRRFRQALSIAINREEINQLVYLGLGEPRQASLISGVAFYDPEWEKMWAEYDPKRASEILDKMGFNKKDKEGFRLRPDGKTLTLTITFPSGVFGAWSDVLEMVEKYWEAIGVKVALQPVERSLYVTRCNAGDLEIGIWNFDRNAAVMSDPGRLLGTVTDGPWAPLYGQWYSTGGKGGEEPKGDIRKIYDLWDKVTVTADEKQRDRYFKEIINLHKRNIWMIGTVGELPQPVVVKNNFRNVPDGLVWDDTLRAPKNARPEQFFFKQ
ncbi:TPA: ABC transporter substrate-binding protein [bacterium]|nr:ABC transporter substrate-binding protein [bacterium]